MGAWDIAMVTCSAMEENCVKLDVVVSNGQEVDAGKCWVCTCTYEYSEDNGHLEPFN